MLQNERLAALSVTYALQNLGRREASGRNDGPFVRMLQRWVAGGRRILDGQPWCACFATYCLYLAAQSLRIRPHITKTASSSGLYQEARRRGLLLRHPQTNCIGLVRGGGRGKSHRHTFFVIGVDARRGVVYGVDGNYNNAVSRSVHPIYGCDFVAVV